jgi:hypothetical protein
VQFVPEKWGRMYNVVLGEAKIKKWDKKSDFCAAKKGAKKLVSSNCPKILENKSSN